MIGRPEISVVVPLFDEEPNVGPLVAAVRGALGPDREWELILVDDGSVDGTAERAAAAAGADARVRLLRLARNYGQTTATQAGFDHARGRVVVTMDGDLQNDPLDIPRLVARLEEGFDLVAGYRVNRKDRFLTRRVPSRAANWVIQRISGVRIRDNGCSLRAYRRELLRGLPLYAEMHRFIPALVAATASARITEVPVRHHPRLRGRSKYGLSRVGKVLIDLVTISMLRWFRERPLVLFAAAALPCVLMAGVFTAATLLAAARPGPDPIVFPGVILLFLGLGGYLVMLGLIAEVALRGRHDEAPRSHVMVTRRGNG